VAAFRNHDLSLYTEPGPIGNYIDARRDADLAFWDVLIAGVGKPGPEADGQVLGLPVNVQTRTAGARSDASTLRIGNKQRVASRGVERAGLSAVALERAEANYRKEHRLADGVAHNYPDWIYREERTSPLLVIHALRIKDAAGDVVHSEPVVAWSIAFPRSDREEKRVEYVVTQTWLRENFRDDRDDDEFDSDES
jgi:hypothetical protein